MGEVKDKVSGTLKEKEGELTGDKAREKQGEAQKEWGNAQGKFKDAKEDVKDKL
jgi:uncharacterized protein YjbJ (UPF0337 family)